MEFLDLIAGYGLTQHVSCATHGAGGTLDVVCTRSDVATPTVDCVDVGLSDHSMLLWTMSLLRPQPVYTTSTRRAWRSFNPDQFQTDLQASALCDDRCWQGLDGNALGQICDDTITRLLDQQIPVVAVLPTHGSTTNAAKPNGYLGRKNVSHGVLGRCPTLARQQYRHGDFNVDNTSLCCVTKRLPSGRIVSTLISSIHAASGSPSTSFLDVAAHLQQTLVRPSSTSFSMTRLLLFVLPVCH